MKRTAALKAAQPLLGKSTPGSDTRRYLLLTLIAATCMVLLVYANLGVWPMGDGSVLTGDLKGIYVNLFSHFKRALFEEQGFFYSFDKGLGGGLIGLFAYYVASPFNLIYLLFPVQNFAVAASIVLLLKIVLSCVFFCLYLRYKFPQLALWSVTLSLCYGFCSYSIAYAQNIMWHDVLVLLPLLCLCVERILQNKSFVPYALLLALAIFANFYIAFMACIFLVIYFVWAQLIRTRESGERGFAAWKGPLWRFGLGSLLAGGANAALLLPVLSGVSAAKGEILSYSFSFETLFSLGQLIPRFALGGFGLFEKEFSGNLPFIYCGALIFLLCICYFAAKGISLYEKLLSGGVILIFALSFWVEGINNLWHGLTAPVWFPARYSFIFCFFLILLAARVVAKRLVSSRTLVISAVLLLLFYIVCFAVIRGDIQGRIIMTMGFVLMYCACLLPRNTNEGGLLGRILGARLSGYSSGAQSTDKPHSAFSPAQSAIPAVVLCVAVMLELILNANYISGGLEKYPLSVEQSFISDASATIEHIEEIDEGGYRIADGFFHSLNDPMLLGYRGTAHFSSIQDVSAQSALQTLGYLAYDGAGPYLHGSTAFADSVLGMRYLVSDGVWDVGGHWEDKGAQTPYAVYENPYAFPLLFAAHMNESMLNVTPVDGDIFDRQNIVYQSLMGEGVILQDVSSQIYAPSGEVSGLTGGLLPIGASYGITAEQSGVYYAFLSYPYPEIDISINGGEQRKYLTSLDKGVVQLGYLQEGQSAGITLLNSIELSAIRFVMLNEEALGEMSASAQQNSGDFTIEDGYVSGSITAQQGMMLATSIPYDEGWQVSINGESVPLQQWAGGLICLPLAEGENRVEMRYHVSGASAVGVVITVTSILGILLAAFYGRLRRVFAKNKTLPNK